MRKVIPVLLLNLFPLLAWGQIQQNRGVLQTNPDAIQRDTKLERAASERYRKIAAVLQPEAKTKLAIASRAFQKASAKSPESSDPYKLARAEVDRQFPGLSARQSDLLSFCLLAEFAEHASYSEGRRKRPEGSDEMSEMTSLRLQMMMDRQSKFMSTLSNIMRKISQTQDTLVANLK